MSELDDLIARVEGASGPDRELDDAICLACGYMRGPGPHPAYTHGPYWYEPGGQLHGEVSPQITASIDLALALVERCLPGVVWRIGHRWEDSCYHFLAVVMADNDYDPGIGGAGSTAPLAILSALLRALKSQSERTGA